MPINQLMEYGIAFAAEMQQVNRRQLVLENGDCDVIWYDRAWANGGANMVQRLMKSGHECVVYDHHAV